MGTPKEAAVHRFLDFPIRAKPVNNSSGTTTSPWAKNSRSRWLTYTPRSACLFRRSSHFMPLRVLASQFEALQAPFAEADVVAVDVEAPYSEVLNSDRRAGHLT